MKLQLKCIYSDATCELEWRPQQEDIFLTLDCSPDFCVSASVYHNNDTFLELTESLCGFFNKLKRISKKDKNLQDERISATGYMGRFSVWSGRASPAGVHFGVSLTAHEDCPWEIYQHLYLSHDDVDTLQTKMQKIAQRLMPK